MTPGPGADDILDPSASGRDLANEWFWEIRRWVLAPLLLVAGAVTAQAGAASAVTTG